MDEVERMKNGKVQVDGKQSKMYMCSYVACCKNKKHHRQNNLKWNDSGSSPLAEILVHLNIVALKTND